MCDNPNLQYSYCTCCASKVTWSIYACTGYCTLLPLITWWLSCNDSIIAHLRTLFHRVGYISEGSVSHINGVWPSFPIIKLVCSKYGMEAPPLGGITPSVKTRAHVPTSAFFLTHFFGSQKCLLFNSVLLSFAFCSFYWCLSRIVPVPVTKLAALDLRIRKTT